MSEESPQDFQPLFDRASKATQQNVMELLQRDATGQKKYGCSLDRADLSLEDWLQHGIEEAADLLGYLRAAKNTLAGNPNPRAADLPNAREVSIPKRIHELVLAISECDDEKNTSLRSLVRSLYVREPELWKLIRCLLELEESKSYAKAPEKMPADFMLKMVGAFDREQQRELLLKGLEHGIRATPIKQPTTTAEE